ncbi:MAG TPA: hypothetical protein DDZ88_07895 [Verrucomicrobiales bacterium]|nr:hypothetical protein [Verrucomicrobiales bacterium]
MSRNPFLRPVILALFFLSAVAGFAFEAVGVNFVTIMVMDSNLVPIKGVKVSIPPRKGEEEYFTKLGIASTAGSWTAIQKVGFITNEFGIATPAYITMTSRYDTDLYGTIVTLPDQIVISAKGFVTKKVTFKYKRFFRAHDHLPLFHVVLETVKEGDPMREVESVISVKQPPRPPTPKDDQKESSEPISPLLPAKK